VLTSSWRSYSVGDPNKSGHPLVNKLRKNSRLDTGQTDPTSPMIGRNLVVNSGAEMGPAVPLPAHALYVPGWSTATKAGSIAPYGGSGWVSTTAPGPPDRGVNVFCGWQDLSDLFQDIDVSAASSRIDSGQVTYVVSGWLGGPNGPVASASLIYLFYDWSGKQLAPTAQLAPGNFSGYQLIEVAATGTLPSGTRRVRISLNFHSSDSLADDIAFALSAPNAPPVITPGKIVSASDFGGFSAIAPGSWIEIKGNYLTSEPLRNNCGGVPGSCWADSDFNNGVGPTTLDGLSVSIGGQAAFIDFASPGQINALVPSNAPTGPVLVTVTNDNGTSDGYPIYVNQTQAGLLAPSAFVVSGKQYVVAQFPDGTFVLPQNAIAGVASRPAMPGETITIYGVGFGPVTPEFDAGTVVTQLNTLTTSLQFLFGSTAVTPSYYGLAPSFTGLYAFNIVVPNVGANNALPLSINLGGTKGIQTLYIAVQ
jgi:uncharacterized protein (TIGR03437 family)